MCVCVCVCSPWIPPPHWISLLLNTINQYNNCAFNQMQQNEEAVAEKRINEGDEVCVGRGGGAWRRSSEESVL